MPMSLASWPRCQNCGRFFANPEREICPECPPPAPPVTIKLVGDRVALVCVQPGVGRDVIVCDGFDDVLDALRTFARLGGPPPIQES